jgi:hypothetical protein
MCCRNDVILAEACRNDVEAYCKDVEPGGYMPADHVPRERFHAMDVVAACSGTVLLIPIPTNDPAVLVPVRQNRR